MSVESGREHWGSRLGFVLAAAGSAIGLGNIWRFPFLVGQHGGAVFVLVYLFIVLFIGLPVMLCEFSVGRAAQKAPNTAFSDVGGHPVWNVIGWTGIITGGFLVLSYYNVVGGWTIKYMLESFTGLAGMEAAEETGAFFGRFIGNHPEVVFYQALFMGVCMALVIGGIKKGIERACKVMMPALFVLVIILIVRSVTLPGAGAGIAFYMAPDFNSLTRVGILAALGQAFFSLSLGLGIMLTYGSYLSKEENLPTAAVYTCTLDTAIALLAGFAIFPAVFAMGFEPGAGVGLTFITLPAVFARMPLGQFFSFAFFLLLFFAAVTSAMSLLEVAVTFAMQKFSMSRAKAVFSMGVVIILLGVPSALTVSGDIKIFGLDIFDTVDSFCNNVLLPLGSLFLCLFVGWFWLQPACKELTNDGKVGYQWLNLWIWCVRVVAPIGILFIFMDGTGLLRRIFG